MEKQLIDLRFTPSIRLTLVGAMEECAVDFIITQFIDYAPKDGFTRVRLTGGKTIDVKESTDRIDYLIRKAAAEKNSPNDDNAPDTA